MSLGDRIKDEDISALNPFMFPEYKVNKNVRPRKTQNYHQCESSSAGHRSVNWQHGQSSSNIGGINNFAAQPSLEIPTPRLLNPGMNLQDKNGDHDQVSDQPKVLTEQPSQPTFAQQPVNTPVNPNELTEMKNELYETRRELKKTQETNETYELIVAQMAEREEVLERTMENLRREYGFPTPETIHNNQQPGQLIPVERLRAEQARVNNLEIQLTQLRETYRVLLRDLATGEEQLKNGVDENNNLRRQLRECQDQLQQAQVVNTQLEQKITGLNTSLEITMNRLRESQENHRQMKSEIITRLTGDNVSQNGEDFV